MLNQISIFKAAIQNGEDRTCFCNRSETHLSLPWSSETSSMVNVSCCFSVNSSPELTKNANGFRKTHNLFCSDLCDSLNLKMFSHFIVHHGRLVVKRILFYHLLETYVTWVYSETISSKYFGKTDQNYKTDRLSEEEQGGTRGSCSIWGT